MLYKDSTWEIREEEAWLPDGRVKRVPRAHRCDAVHVLAFPEPETILMLREYRPFYGEWVWMVPSGKVDKEKDVALAAQRELQEETGFKAKSLKHWFSTNHSEQLAMTNHVFLARDLESAPLEQDAHELIEVHPMKLEEAVRMASEGKIRHTVSAYALLRYGAVKEQGKEF